jgi:hypothetical protein
VLFRSDLNAIVRGIFHARISPYFKGRDKRRFDQIRKVVRFPES